MVCYSNYNTSLGRSDEEVCYRNKKALATHVLGQKPKASITSIKTNISCASERKGLAAHVVGQKPGSRASTRTLLRFTKDEQVVMMSIKTNTRCAAS